jgi:DNA-binding transcriptional ArsR family regulator
MTKTRPSLKGKVGRAYPDETLRAATHPTRQTILKSLQESDRSTTDLEQMTGENRYNLYHHLAILEQAGLVGHRLRDSRSKEFFLRKAPRRQSAVYQLTREETPSPARWDAFFRSLAALAGEEIPGSRRVTSATVILAYSSDVD